MAFDISDKQIAVTESVLGRKFPPVYRSIMNKNNGGTAFTKKDQWDLFPIQDVSDRKRMSRSCNHVIVETKSAKEWRGFPAEALAIATNGLGDLMILLPSDINHFGDRLCVFWHETGSVEPLADDLSAFEIE